MLFQKTKTNISIKRVLPLYPHTHQWRLVSWSPMSSFFDTTFISNPWMYRWFAVGASRSAIWVSAFQRTPHPPARGQPGAPERGRRSPGDKRPLCQLERSHSPTQEIREEWTTACLQDTLGVAKLKMVRKTSATQATERGRVLCLSAPQPRWAPYGPWGELQFSRYIQGFPGRWSWRLFVTEQGLCRLLKGTWVKAGTLS